jgi:hypothetical protein
MNLDDAITNKLLDLHTGQPGRVEKFYADTYEVDVKLVCKKPLPHADGGFVYEDAPVIPRVMVCCFGNSASWMKVELVPGDLVWILSPEVSTDEFIDTGEVSQPSNVTRHGLLGSIAIPFVLPSRTPTGAVVSLAGGADYVALAAKVDQRIAALENHYIAHVHVVTDPVSGPLTSAPAAPPLTPGASTAATKVKAT